MRLSRILTAGALAMALTLAGCSNGEESESAAETTSAPEAPEEGESADASPESDEPTGEAPEAEDGETAEVPEGAVSSGIDADAHPFCAVLAKYEDVDEIEGTPTEEDIALVKQMRDDAVHSAPDGMEDQVEFYFDTVLEMAEESLKSGEAPDIQIDELGEEFEEAFGAILGFSFETCLDLDLDLEDN